MSIKPRCVAVEHDQPGARCRAPACPSRDERRAAARPGPRARCRASSSWTRRRDHQPVEPRRDRAGTRTSRTSCARASAARVACASKSPCSASTPTQRRRRRCRRAPRYQPRWARSCSPSSLRALEADHRRAEPREAAATRSGSCQCVVASTIAARARRRVLGLEDARADEHAFGAELHHQRGVGRRGDAAGAEQRRPAGCRRARPRARGRAARRSSLAAVAQLVVVERPPGGGSRR